VNKKEVVIINSTGGSPYHGPNFRSYYTGKNLLLLGYEVTIIANSYFHKFYNTPLLKGTLTNEVIDGINYIWIKTKKYQTRGFFQVLNQIQFTLKLYKNFHKMGLKDATVFIVSSPVPFSIFPVIFYSKIWNIKVIFEIRDLWPLVLQELGNFSKWHPYIYILKKTEKFAYLNSDHLVSVKPGDFEYIGQKYNVSKDKFSYIPNGFDFSIKPIKVLPVDMRESIPKNKFIVGYTGSLSIAYGIIYLLKAARELKNEGIHFIIIGSGPEKQDLINFVEKNKLLNVSFLGHLELSIVTKLIEYFDVCFLGYRKAGWLQYGISSNKLFGYMHSAKPIIAAMDTKYDLITKGKCGFTVSSEDPYEIETAIKRMYKLPKNQRDELGENGKKYLLKHHSFEQIAEKYSALFNKLYK